MTEFGRKLDAWITREPFEDAEEFEQLRCESCGVFLPREADRSEFWEDGYDCDGTETFHDEPYSDELVAILGEDFRGQSYKISVSACEIEVGPHEPHRVITQSGATHFRRCRKCGLENLEVEV